MPTEEEFFDPNIVKSFAVGYTTKSEVRMKMGEPYIRYTHEDGREMWVYDYNVHLQAALFFEKEVLDEKLWTSDYSHPTDPEGLYFEANPEVRKKVRK